MVDAHLSTTAALGGDIWLAHQSTALAPHLLSSARFAFPPLTHILPIDQTVAYKALHLPSLLLLQRISLPLVPAKQSVVLESQSLADLQRPWLQQTLPWSTNPAAASQH